MHTELGTCPIFIGKGRLERLIRLHILYPITSGCGARRCEAWNLTPGSEVGESARAETKIQMRERKVSILAAKETYDGHESAAHSA